jgi:hypothetical protein
MVRPKAAMVVDLQGQPPHDGGISLHGDRDGDDDMGQQLHAGVQQQDR